MPFDELVQGSNRGNPQDIARREHQPKFTPQPEHPCAEPNRQGTCRLFRIGNARPCQCPILLCCGPLTSASLRAARY